MPHRRRLTARAFVVFAWLQGVLIPPAIALAIRHGVAGVSWLPEAELQALALAGGGAYMSRWRGRGAIPYTVCAALIWAIGSVT